MRIKRDAIADFLQRWLMPIMAILGWGLLIVFYVTMIGGGGDEENLPPVIHDIQVTQTIVETGQTVSAKAFATDPNGDQVHYIWGAVEGRIQLDRFKDDQCTYIAPDLPGRDVITLRVYDKDGSDNRFEIITVVEGAEE